MPAQANNILCLIPAHNEADHIVKVVSQCLQFLPVLVVDDGSDDDTAALAAAAGADVLRQTPNQGKGAALIAGYKAALQHGYDAVVMLDGDEQHDPQEIPKFLQAHQNTSANLVIGQRNYREMPLRRGLPNTIGKAMFSWAVGQEIPDNQSGYRLLRRPMMEVMLDSDERAFEFEVIMIVECLKRKLGLAWVPIRTIYAGEKSHMRPLHQLREWFRVCAAARRRMQE